MQFFGRAKPPVGVIYDSDMGERIDTALAFALLYGCDGKDEMRVVGISVSRSNVEAASYCEAVARFYASNTTGPLVAYLKGPTIGLAADGKLSQHAAMLTAPLGRQNSDGKPLYTTTIQKPTDTAEPATLIRNVLTAQHDQNAIIVLAGRATDLARLLDLHGAKDLIARKVRYLVLSAGAYPDGAVEFRIHSDIPAARKLFAEWPTAIVATGEEVGSKLLFPAASIEKDFAWSQAHPVVDAYHAYKPMPYDAPTWDMAAALYAARPKEGYFKVSDPGTIRISDDGRTLFAPSPEGKHRYLIADPSQSERIIKTYTELASAQPVRRVLRFPKQEEKKDDEKKEDEQDSPKP